MTEQLAATQKTQMRLKAAEDLIASPLAGEVVILNLKNGVYYGLNQVGARVWELLQGSPTLAEVEKAIVAEFDVDPGHCQKDLNRLMLQFKRHGLVEDLGPTPAKQ